jgi:hypothetical protein
MRTVSQTFSLFRWFIIPFLGFLLRVTAHAQSAPAVTLNPVNTTVNAGATATFTAAASGSPAPTVQWQSSTDGGSTFQNVAGATSTTLSLPGVSASQNGNRFRAVFSNVSGTATTVAATMTVNSEPSITTNPSSQSVSSGGTVTFTAAASGSPAPTVQWQLSTDGGATFANIAGATSTTLSFAAAGSQNGNQYRAVFSNSAGSATTTAATLTVKVAPSITINPVDTTVDAGVAATFTAAATGNPTPSVQWQSSIDGGATFQNLAGATNTTLSVPNVSVGQNGTKFRAVFSNISGTATTVAATMTVAIAPKLTRISVTGTNLNLIGTNIVAGTYILVTTTNLTTALAQWTPVMTNTFAANSSFSVIATNQFSAGVAKKFYHYRTP